MNYFLFKESILTVGYLTLYSLHKHIQIYIHTYTNKMLQPFVVMAAINSIDVSEYMHLHMYVCI